MMASLSGSLITMTQAHRGPVDEHRTMRADPAETRAV